MNPASIAAWGLETYKHFSVCSRGQALGIGCPSQTWGFEANSFGSSDPCLWFLDAKLDWRQVFTLAEELKRTSVLFHNK
jgi:hypothetical protein